MVTFSNLDDGLVAPRLPDRSSRRQVLTHLAGLGLAAAGGLALLPEEAATMRKLRGKRRRGKQRRNGGEQRNQTVRTALPIDPNFWRVKLAGTVT